MCAKKYIIIIPVVKNAIETAKYSDAMSELLGPLRYISVKITVTTKKVLITIQNKTHALRLTSSRAFEKNL